MNGHQGDYKEIMELDFEAIQKEIENGYINVQRHPIAPLRIFNYSQRAQFDWRWTKETMACRGLILDDQNRIVARPFPKFFSYDQLNGIVPDEPFEAFEKLDGSLGISYHDSKEMQIATRGSFASDQAMRARTMLRTKYAHIELNPELTYLFEIIYPENRIVVDYGGAEELVLLAIIETQTGKELPLQDIGFPVVKRYDGIKDFQEILSQQDPSREGFVIRFQSGQRVKIKFDEYKRLHKLVTGVNARHIWDCLRNGTSLNDLLERVPDEYFQWVRETENDLLGQFASIESQARGAMRFNGTRKELAEGFKLCPYPGIMFSILDNKDYRESIWRIIKPSGTTPFRVDSEN
jgi:hypothetical protein